MKILLMALLLSWNHPNPSNVTGYNLYYKLENPEPFVYMDTTIETEYEVDLDTDYTYFFAVTAFNYFGESKYSKTLKVKYVNGKWKRWELKPCVGALYLLLLNEKEEE